MADNHQSGMQCGAVRCSVMLCDAPSTHESPTCQGGMGLVWNVTYKDIRVTDVAWPIIIDQFYCDTSASKCREQKEAVAVTDVSFINVKGTANGTHAILFNCSRSVPCTSLLLS
ncbi:unnamed protein product, partial [Closterium sp. NIES-53]